jgi:replicative DNA helicase
VAKSDMKKQPELEQPMPKNLEAERSVLGAVLLDNHALTVAADVLTAQDFFLDQHRRVFAHMLTLQATGQAIDIVMLVEVMQRSGELEPAGGAPYIAQLADGMPRVSNVLHYAGIVKQKAMLRQLIHASVDIKQRAFDGQDDVDTILEGARAVMAELGTLRQTGPVPIKTVVSESFDRLEKIFKDGRAVTGLPTGYDQMDRLTSGLQPSELVLIAARPSMGKTAMALNLTENLAIRRNVPAVIFSMEMSKESLLTRLLASVGQVDAHKFRTGHLSRDDWRKMTEALATIAAAPLWIDDASSPTLFQVASRAERLQRDCGVQVVFVDYLQLIAPSQRNANRQEQVSGISRGLKAMAKDLKIPVVALSQLTRAPEQQDRAPLLSDLRESGSLEQEADMVWFLHRPAFHKKDATPEERESTELIVAKQRNGPIDMVQFVFRSKFTRFEEAAPDYFNEPERENLPYKDDE